MPPELNHYDKIKMCALIFFCRRTRPETTRRLYSTSAAGMINAGLWCVQQPWMMSRPVAARQSSTWDELIDPEFPIPSHPLTLACYWLNYCESPPLPPPAPGWSFWPYPLREQQLACFTLEKLRHTLPDNGCTFLKCRYRCWTCLKPLKKIVGVLFFNRPTCFSLLLFASN